MREAWERKYQERGIRPERYLGSYVQVQLSPMERKARGLNGAGYMLKHRFVMEEHLGRPLLPDETVHHKNGVRDDNRIENLELWSGKHARGHRVEDLVAYAKEILDLYG